MVTLDELQWKQRGQVGSFLSLSPFPRNPLSAAAFGLCPQAEVPEEGSREDVKTSAKDRKKKTKGKPASVKSETL